MVTKCCKSDLPITEAVNKWLLACAVPRSILVPSSIPHDLVHDLRYSDRMSARAIHGPKTSGVGVSDVALVIW